MSDAIEGRKRPSRRLRRQTKGDDASNDSGTGSESDTIFEEEYESAEDHASIEDETEPPREEDAAGYIQDEVVALAEVTAALDLSTERYTELSPSNDAIKEMVILKRREPVKEDKTVDVEEDEPAQEDTTAEDEEPAEDGEKSDRGEEDNEALEEKRGSGDGQEEPTEEGEDLDDDEDLKNPAYIPRRGAYYQHDVRNDGNQKGDKRQRKERKLWKEDDHKWLHDKYNEEEQMPKTQYDLVTYHGFDIRDPTQLERMEAPGRRGRGRGPRGGSGSNGIIRGRGRGRRVQRSPMEDGGGDWFQEREPLRYNNTTSYRTNHSDFPELTGQGDQRNISETENILSYAERKRGQSSYNGEIESEGGGSINIRYQSDKTYYEKDSIGHREESYKNVTEDYRYIPSRPVQNYHTEVDNGQTEHKDRRRSPLERNFGDQKQFYQLEFVNKNYQSDGVHNVSPNEDVLGDEELIERTSEPEPQEIRKKSYSSERQQRTRPSTELNEEPKMVPPLLEHKSEVTPLSNLRNLKIQVKGSERVVLYQDVDDEENNADSQKSGEEEEEDQRRDRRERSRPKRYSSQRQRGQEQATGQEYYREGSQTSSETPERKHEGSPQQGGASHAHRGTGPVRQHPPSHRNQGVPSLPVNLQNLMQQGIMMPPEGPMPQGVRAPHLPSPAFFQQPQGNIPAPYYVGPMVNYGTPQYPMGTQWYPMSMPPPSPQAGVPAPPPAAAPTVAPARSPARSSTQNPSVQQVGGVTYYSPMQQPLQISHPPPKRQSKPLTIESPPEIKR